MGRIVHDEKRCGFFHVVIKYADNLRMYQASNGLSFTEKTIHVFIWQLRVEYFDGSVNVQTHMLSEIDLGKTSLSYQTGETVVAKLLSNAICHLWNLRGIYYYWLSLGGGTRGLSSCSNVSINALIGFAAFFMSVRRYASLFPSI